MVKNCLNTLIFKEYKKKKKSKFMIVKLNLIKSTIQFNLFKKKKIIFKIREILKYISIKMEIKN
jgi:hypothetical protein